MTLKNDGQRNDILSEISNLPYVVIVEPNYIYTADRTPDDPNFSKQWAMLNNGQNGEHVNSDIDANLAWDITTGTEKVVVGIIDSGFDYNHSDLKDNIWINPLEIAGNQIDDDGNGYIDDIHGISTYYRHGDPMDTGKHGTHVAGTIGAVGNNSIGVTGTAWNVKMAACGFLDPNGRGKTEDAIRCIKYMIDLKKRGINIRVLNNSWGGGAKSVALEAAIKLATENNMLFVAAAGNDGWNNNNIPHYPSDYPNDNIISVTATDSKDSLANFSNFSDTGVDIAAPGVNIISTVPGNKYEYFKGTSMATPHVSGAAALLLSIVYQADNNEIRSLLLNTGDELDALLGKTVTGKRINIAKAIFAADPSPKFRLHPTPSHQLVKQGESTQASLNIKSIYDWDGVVNLKASSNLPLDFQLSSDQARAGENIAININTQVDTPYCDYIITVDGTSGSLTTNEKLYVEVTPSKLTPLTFETEPGVTIPDLSDIGVTSKIVVDNDVQNYDAEIFLDISHQWRGDLVIELISPLGKSIILVDREGGSADDIIRTIKLPTLRRDMIKGEWTLKIHDRSPWVTGTLNKWSLGFKTAQPITQDINCQQH